MMHDSIDHLIELKEEKDGALSAQHTGITGGEEYSKISVTATRLNTPPILIEYGGVAFGMLDTPIALLPVPIEADAIVISNLVDRGPRALATFYKIQEFNRHDRLDRRITREELQKRENYATAKHSVRGDPRVY